MTYVKYELTLGNLLRSAVKRNPNQVIVDPEKGKYTFSQFESRVNSLARGLVNIGVNPHDRVAVLDWDTRQYLESFYAVPMAGAVLHTVNIRYPVELIYYTMQHAEDSFIIVRDEIARMFINYKDLFGFVKGWIIYSSSETRIDFPFSNVYYYDDLISDASNSPLPAVVEDDIATLFYTSGSTGMPKGVTFSHRDVVLHAYGLIATLSDEPASLNSRDVIMPLVPMFHVHAWGLPQTFLIKGCKYVLAGRYNPAQSLKLIREEGVTTTAMVPSILYMLINEKGADEILPPRNLKAIIGGGALSQGLRDAASKLNIKTMGAYGMSETAPLLTAAVYNFDTADMSDEQRGTYQIKAGLPASMVEVRIVDKNGKEIPRGVEKIGEITVRAPWLTREYYKDPESTKKLWQEGWLHTGDLGYVDSMGYLTIVDREKDSVKSGGEFIPTLILEDIISLYGKIGEVAVIGRKDDKWGERPIAIYTSKEPVDVANIKEFLLKFVEQKRIEKFWIPDEFIRVNEFEKGSTGKIDKKILRQKYA